VLISFKNLERSFGIVTRCGNHEKIGKEGNLQGGNEQITSIGLSFTPLDFNFESMPFEIIVQKRKNY
jgi:hypothetical protein